MRSETTDVCFRVRHSPSTRIVLVSVWLGRATVDPDPCSFRNKPSPSLARSRPSHRRLLGCPDGRVSYIQITDAHPNVWRLLCTEALGLAHISTCSIKSSAIGMEEQQIQIYINAFLFIDNRYYVTKGMGFSTGKTACECV